MCHTSARLARHSVRCRASHARSGRSRRLLRTCGGRRPGQVMMGCDGLGVDDEQRRAGRQSMLFQHAQPSIAAAT